MLTRTIFVLIGFALAGIPGGANVTTADTIEPPSPIDPCDDTEYGDESRTGIFRGIYTLAFEQSTFQPDGSKCRWWMVGDIDALLFTLGTGRSYAGSSARVEVEGLLSVPGRYGHRGGARRELRVSRLLSAQQESGNGWKPLILKAPPTEKPPGPLPPEKLRQ